MLVYRLARLLFELVLIVLYRSNIRNVDYHDPYCILIDFMALPFTLRTFPDIIYIATYPTSDVGTTSYPTNDTINSTLLENPFIVLDFHQNLEARDDRYRENMNSCFLATSELGLVGLWFLLRYNHKNEPRRMPNRYFRYYLWFLFVFYIGMMLLENDFEKNLSLNDLSILKFDRDVLKCILQYVWAHISFMFWQHIMYMMDMTRPNNLQKSDHQYRLYQQISRMKALFIFHSVVFLINMASMVWAHLVSNSVFTSVMFTCVIVFSKPYRNRIPILRRLWCA